MTPLLKQVSTFENLLQAFTLCARGKRKSRGYQDFFLGFAGRLQTIQAQLDANCYRWGRYQTFLVHDPKKREILAATFRDRVVHTALSLVLGPYLERHLHERVYACRIGKGNRQAVLDLQQQLALFGQRRYVVKLDVQKYFQNIGHPILLEAISGVLPDSSLQPLLASLLASYPAHGAAQRGIPIGNLTSQLFANFYLAPLDWMIVNSIGPYSGEYFRYMDDLVLVLPSKHQAHHLVAAIVEFAATKLQLTIPARKIVHLANLPVPFLGFLLDGEQYDILARNRHRAMKKIKRLQHSRALASTIEHCWQSLQSWIHLESVKEERPPRFRGRRASGWELEQWYQRRCLCSESEQFPDEHEQQHLRSLCLAAQT